MKTDNNWYENVTGEDIFRNILSELLTFDIFTNICFIGKSDKLLQISIFNLNIKYLSPTYSHLLKFYPEVDNFTIRILTEKLNLYIRKHE